MGIDRTNLIEIGIIQRGYGLKGEVRCLFHHEVPSTTVLKVLFLQRGYTLVPYVLEYFSLRHRQGIMKMQHVNSPQEAKALQGCAVFTPREQLSTPMHPWGPPTQLLTYQVFDREAGNLGTVKAIRTASQQLLLLIEHRGKEILIPYHRDLIMDISHAQQHVVMQLPEGLIEPRL